MAAVDTILMFVVMTLLFHVLLNFSVPMCKHLEEQKEMPKGFSASKVVEEDTLDVGEMFLTLEDHEEALELFDKFLLGEEEIGREENEPENFYYLRDVRKLYIKKWMTTLIRMTYRGEVEWEESEHKNILASDSGFSTKKYIRQVFSARPFVGGHTYLAQIAYHSYGHNTVYWNLCVVDPKGMKVDDYLSDIDEEATKELWGMAKDSAENGVSAKALLSIVRKLDKV